MDIIGEVGAELIKGAEDFEDGDANDASSQVVRMTGSHAIDPSSYDTIAPPEYALRGCLGFILSCMLRRWLIKLKMYST